MDYVITLADGSRYLAHHGVKGMHWGVWNEETRQRRMGRIDRYKAKAKDAESAVDRRKYENKANYLQELNDPGSTKLSAQYLRDKKTLNTVGMVAAGRQAIIEGLAVVDSSLALAAVAPELISAGASAVAFVPGIAAVGVGVAATGVSAKLAVDAYKRRKSIDKAIDVRAKRQVFR